MDATTGLNGRAPARHAEIRVNRETTLGWGAGGRPPPTRRPWNAVLDELIAEGAPPLP